MNKISSKSVLLFITGKLQKKGLVVEVQSHQQAIKLANPIADLEQTINRGMNDPYTDPHFVMNQINAEFFGNSMKSINAGTATGENEAHSKELMAFRNLPMNSMGINSVPENLLPSNPIMQHAVKDNNVPLRQPAVSIDEALSKIMKIRNSLTAKKHIGKSKPQSLNSQFDLQKMASYPTLPSNLKIAHVSSDVIHPSLSKSEKGNARSFDSAVETGLAGIDENQPTDAATQSVVNSPDKSNYPINIGEDSQNIGDTLSSVIEKNGPKSNDILSTNPGSISNKEMEENFSSIRAFLDADSVLRTKKVMEPEKSSLEDLLHSKHKKHTVPKAKRTLRKMLRPHRRTTRDAISQQ